MLLFAHEKYFGIAFGKPTATKGLRILVCGLPRLEG